MYNNKLVMCVLVANKPLKELANGCVPIPFNSEYIIRLKNKSDRRALAKLSIDGENISGAGFIIPAHGSIDIERPIYSNHSFKFVSLDSDEALLEGKNGPNIDKVKGVILAECSFEKEPAPAPQIIERHHYYDWQPPYYPRPWEPYYPRPWEPYYPNRYEFWCNTSQSLNNIQGSIGGSGQNNSNGLPDIKWDSNDINWDSNGLSCNFDTLAVNDVQVTDVPNQLIDGCTVEGQVNSQQFSSAYIDVEDNVITLRVFLQGYWHNNKPDVESPYLRAEVRKQTCKAEPLRPKATFSESPAQSAEALEKEIEDLEKIKILELKKKELENEIAQIKKG